MISEGTGKERDVAEAYLCGRLLIGGVILLN